MVTSQKAPCMYCYTQCLQPWNRPPLTHASPVYSWTHPGKSGSVSCGVTAPFSWVLVHTSSVYALQESISQSWVSSGSSMVGLMVTHSKRAYAIPKSAAPRALHQWQSTADLYLHRRHSNTVLSSSVSVSLASLVQIFSFNDIEQFNYNYWSMYLIPVFCCF